MKSDGSIFLAKIGADIIIIIGGFIGLMLMLFGAGIVGLIILGLSFFGGVYLRFKAKRRTGYILYEGGRI